MRSRVFFRDDGHVIRTHSRAREAVFVVGCCVVLLGLLAWGYAVDDSDPQAGAFEAGLAVGLAQAQQTVADAYRQGMTDALVGATGCNAAPVDLSARPAQAMRIGAAQ